MNILVIHTSFALLAGSLVEAVITGKRSVPESLILGVNIPASGMDFSSGSAAQAPPQSIALMPHPVQVFHPVAVPVPHPVAVRVPHPIVVPIERPVPFPVDRPVPYPVPIIKKYFIPVPFKVIKAQHVPVSNSANPDGSGSENGPDISGGSEIATESYPIYTNELGQTDASYLPSGVDDATANIDGSSLTATKTAKRNSSFRIHVKES